MDGPANAALTQMQDTSPPDWLVRAIRRVEGFGDAADAAWKRLPVDQLDRFGADAQTTCVCSARAAVLIDQTLAHGVLLRPVKLVQFQGKLGTDVVRFWIGRCAGCRTIFWAM